MAKKISAMLYDLSRNAGKAASWLNTAETVATGNPQKIVKHASRRAISGLAYGLARKINKSIK